MIMSKSYYKNTKEPNKEFWSKRPGSKHGACGSGKVAKGITKRRERMCDKDVIAFELDEYYTEGEGNE
jgi:hypothetical protein